LTTERLAGASGRLAGWRRLPAAAVRGARPHRL